MEESIRTPNKEKLDLIRGDDNNKGSDFLCRSKSLGKLSQDAVRNIEDLSNKSSLQFLQEIVKLPTTGIFDAAKHSEHMVNHQATKSSGPRSSELYYGDYGKTETFLSSKVSHGVL
ncbi:hypothetical protein J1N35_045050 [Gossypium stocksii]|uniref:Uncharacterized protein n=1 Tax=Gossypium stocksii TaxID=47602 RepID=A0A9D3UA86_9ROSI|nr:hypothetical protein J1N35_045050 [Gossypium stocksii]